MEYRFARLTSFVADHGYYAGTDLSFLAWEPTPACAGALKRMRLLYRAQRNGGVVLYEVDTTQPGALPLVPFENAATLTFVARAVHGGYPGATEPPPTPSHPFYFSNRVGELVGGVGRPHAGAVAGIGDQVRLVPPRTTLRYDGISQPVTLQIIGVNGVGVVEASLTPEAGSVEAMVNLEAWAPGLFEVRLGTATLERLYADASLSGEAPAALLELVFRPEGSTGFAILDSAGQVVAGGVNVRARWLERATVWRYVVVPRTDPDLDPADLRLQHTPETGTAFAFTNAGAQTVPPGGVEAVLFESTTVIGLRALPHRGMALQTRAAADAEFTTALTDLPNPRPDALSLASTSERPVSEVFVYL